MLQLGMPVRHLDLFDDEWAPKAASDRGVLFMVLS
jgi:predicted alpha/beta hydrolase